MPLGRWVIAVFVLAGSNFITGRLGLFLAVPPGFATVIFPPSGIALAGILLLGNRVFLGIWLGSFLFNLSLAVETPSSDSIFKIGLVASSIAGGSTLQALLGAHLIRSIITFPNDLNQEKDILKFFILGGPVSCLLAATWGVGTLWQAGVVPGAELFHNWLTWWAGDTLGVLVFTPLLLIAFAEPRGAWRRRWASVGLPLCFVFSLAVAFVIYGNARERDRILDDFEGETDKLTISLSRNIGNYVESLYSIESFIRTHPESDSEQFRDLVGRFLSRHPGIHALEWIPRIPQSERKIFEAKIGLRLPNFQITEKGPNGLLVRAKDRAEYFPVYFVEPIEGNEHAIGYDLSSDKNRFDALTKARAFGNAMATGRISLVQEQDNQKGFLVFLPIYSEIHSNPSENNDLLGFALGVFRIGDVIEETAQNLNWDDFNLKVWDGNGLEGNQILYFRGQGGIGTPKGTDGFEMGKKGIFDVQKKIQIAGRQWILEFQPTQSYLGQQKSLQTWALLGGGPLFTGLLGAFLMVLSGRTRRVEQLLEEISLKNECLLSEISERKKAEAVLSEKTEELSRSNSDLQQFAYVASHDLQEPLRNVASFTQLLSKRFQGKMDPKADQYIQFAVEGVHRMQQLIQDLLSYSRVGSGAKKFDLTYCEEIFERVCENLRVSIQESGGMIKHEPLPEVYGDPVQLNQLFQNLISNTLKFRNNRPPEINIQARSQNGEWLFSIKDNGIGIDPEYFNRIFMIFQRLHTRTEYQGTGVGLSICKKIVEGHGGRIWVESQPGYGTTFFFTLPKRK